ncbi:helix-turn-helix domain-containing protein [Aromatoleum bremense]|uniref:XRE family transcriptional regulator n=1 Tax=Aromatoleum bremense TaxID=76115 RepID=A0ABX1NWI5_9RHOO|nr:helix-turn-helix transcriptional regulator [Aromatoleum bremense]NMG16384.1 XRE family transcriptional regulator [Aromatoleum bremense]QTQ31286.1 Putative lambda repressor-like protein [Aromatoleum bremense]
MNNESQVARFITGRIEATGKLQKDIAEKVGFEKPNMITMIKQGKTKLPLDKVGPMAKALEVDPVHLLKLCMEEYHPNTWKAIAPLIGAAVITADERRMLNALRAWAGGPFLAAMSEEQKHYFENFMASLRAPSSIQ